MIGYNPEGYASLMAGINSRKNNLDEILNTFPTVQSAIESAWTGPDADRYLGDLENLIAKTRTTIDSVYSEMSNNFTATYNAWVDKQHGGY